MNFIYYLFLFYIYSIIGWIAESLYVAIRNKKFIDRGFLIGPYCPIYGSGAIIIINYLTQYQSNPLTIFLLGALLCSILDTQLAISWKNYLMLDGGITAKINIT